MTWIKTSRIHLLHRSAFPFKWSEWGTMLHFLMWNSWQIDCKSELLYNVPLSESSVCGQITWSITALATESADLSLRGTRTENRYNHYQCIQTGTEIHFVRAIVWTSIDIESQSENVIWHASVGPWWAEDGRWAAQERQTEQWAFFSFSFYWGPEIRTTCLQKRANTIGVDHESNIR